MAIQTFLWSILLVTLIISGRQHSITPKMNHLINQGTSEVQIKYEPSLGFSNKTGSCFGQSQLNSLIGFLNKASSLYRSDFKQNLKYIQENMDAAFGTSNERYNVFIQDNSQYTSQFLIHPIGENGCNYAALSYGINLINPEWSYLVVKNRYDYSPSFQYIGSEGQGTGVSAETKAKIQKFIVDIQKRLFTCLCRGLTGLATNIKNQDGQEWSIICQTENFNHGYIAVKNDQWIDTAPFQCGYLLYVQ